MSQIPPFAVHTAHPSADEAVVSVTGELDLPSTDLLREPLLTALEAPVVVLDLAACTFCDSSGLRTIVEAAHKAEAVGHALRLAGVTEAVRRVLELAEVGFISQFPDVASALKG